MFGGGPNGGPGPGAGAGAGGFPLLLGSFAFSWGSFLAGAAAASSLTWVYRGIVGRGRGVGGGGGGGGGGGRHPPLLLPGRGDDGGAAGGGAEGDGGSWDPKDDDGDDENDDDDGDGASGPVSEVGTAAAATAASEGSRRPPGPRSAAATTAVHDGAAGGEGGGGGGGSGGGNGNRRKSIEYALSSLADLSHRIGEITVGGGGGGGGGADPANNNDVDRPKRQRWPWDRKRAPPPGPPPPASWDDSAARTSTAAAGKQVRFSDAAAQGGDAGSSAPKSMAPPSTRQVRGGRDEGGIRAGEGGARGVQFRRDASASVVDGEGARGGEGPRNGSPPPPMRSAPLPSSTGMYLSSSMPRTPSPDRRPRDRLRGGGGTDGDGDGGEWSVAGASAVRIDDEDHHGYDERPPPHGDAEVRQPPHPPMPPLAASVPDSAPAHSSSPPSGAAAAPPPPPSLHHDKEGQPCIGSIFGLDVGGSLAKLVYFEECNPDEVDSAMQLATSMRSSMIGPSTVAPPPPPRRAESSGTASSSSIGSSNGGGDDEGDNGVASLRQDLYLRRMGRTTSCPPDGWAAAWGVQQQELERGQQGQGAAHWNPPINNAREVRSAGFGIPNSSVRRHRRQVSAADAGDASAVFRRTASADSIHEEDDGGDLVNDDGDDGGGGEGGESELQKSKIRKSVSMVDLFHSRDHSLALDRFYNFVRCLDWYERGAKEKRLSFHSRELGGEFHFIRFETRKMADAMDLIKSHNLHLNIREMGATGGGAHKFASDWETNLGIRMVKVEELDGLVAGMQFVLADVVGECYTFKPERGCVHDDAAAGQHGPAANGDGEGHGNGSNRLGDDAPDDAKTNSDADAKSARRRPLDEWWWSRKVKRDMVHTGRTSGSYASNIYPYLLVTIGTGVSILRVDGVRKHERVSGSTIGGGTYWGLCRLLTDVENFKDALDLADRGDPAKVDMMVGDIYGEKSDALDKLGLSANVVASSFGKLVAKHDPASGVTQEDLARALLMMVTNNIGQVAYLNAQLSGTPRIYFVGNFLRHNRISQQRLSFAINYWSKGKMEALFLEHEGYFGALGAFLLSQGIDSNKQRRPTRRKGDLGQFRGQGRGEGGGVPTGKGKDDKDRERGIHSDSSLSGDVSPYSPIQRTRSLSM